MKIKKKTAMFLSFTIGTLLFATTALADITSKNGYEQLKDTLKTTANDCTSKFDNFTISTATVIKDNGKTVFAKDRESKWDRRKNSIETTFGEATPVNPRTSHYYYFDQRTQINGWGEEYNVVEFDKTLNRPTFTNPFAEPKTEDIEKIADVILGSIGDRVVVTENPDGSKTFSGSMTEVEIPPTVNAAASLLINRQYLRQFMLTREVFVTAIKGKSVVNKNGVLESIMGNVVLRVKDQQGRDHELTFEFLGELKGINTTKVSKPDLTAKKGAEKPEVPAPIFNPKLFAGKFKNDVLIEKNGKFVKIGERILDITRIDNNSFAGRYHEEYKSGFETYSADSLDFTFESKFMKGSGPGFGFGVLTYTNKSGSKIQGGITFDGVSNKVSCILDSEMNRNFDPDFTPVLE